MFKVLHFWPVSGGMGLRFNWIVGELKSRGIGEQLCSVAAVFKSILRQASWWQKSGNKIIIFASLVCPLVVLIKIFFPKIDVIYFVRGDEVLEAQSRNRKLRRNIALFFQYVLWRGVKAKHIFVSWDLEVLFRRRYGAEGISCVVPNTIGRELPATRAFNGIVTIVGDFGTVKDIEWILKELSGSEFSVRLYGNSIQIPLWCAENIKSFGVIDELRVALENSTLLVVASNSEGYPNIANEALESGCAVVVHNAFPFEFFPLNEQWKFSKQSGALLQFLRDIRLKNDWRYDEENVLLRHIVEKNWLDLLLAEVL